ncbi:restriction endonuclease subunit S [Sphingomonas sp. RHCKR7]|uniref:restriction endonuclease subunit S n=1 Tax=Sphingomonas folli TaxID=2862497 RepID=UPI001CA4D582|nr:restriction endonuclease subunit S [Sphingomonas folli]MBW6528194.1 restriction endonuclease subunit S [Sphingomonas folli]
MMPSETYRDFRVDELFDIGRGKTRYIKRYYREHPGPYPVFSASTDEAAVAGWVDRFDFNEDCLTWTTNGYAGEVIRRNGRFCATRDVGVLSPKKELRDRISLAYFVPALTTAFKAAATGRLKENGESDYTKIATGAAAGVFVSVPISSDKLPDLAAQEEVAGRFEKVASFQRKLAGMSNHVSSLNVAYPSLSPPFKEFALLDIFEEPFRGSGKMTQRYILTTPGPFPVYTGSSRRNEVAGYVASADFEGPCLTWAADGYAGHTFVRDGAFSANSHCGILRVRDDVRDKIYLPYMELVLTPVFLDIAIGRFREDGSPDYTRVTTDMVKQCSFALPTDQYGLPDLERQQKLADKMNALRSRQQLVISRLERIAKMRVTIAGFEPR